MPPKRSEVVAKDERLATAVHRLTEHVERINSHVSADDESSAWFELERLKTYLERACDPS